MSVAGKTAIITGASQGIGAGTVRVFLSRGYNVVATSRTISRSPAFSADEKLAIVEGDIGDVQTARVIAATAVSRFGSIDTLVNNAGVFYTKSFTEYTVDDFRSVISTNLAGFFHITQLAVRQMLAQKRPGSIVTVTAALAHNPIRGVTASVPMITKGGLETATRHLAMEYAKDQIRFNAVAPGVVSTPLHRDTPEEVMKGLSPMGRPSTVDEIADAVAYLAEAPTITGATLYVDGGSHLGRW